LESSSPIRRAVLDDEGADTALGLHDHDSASIDAGGAIFARWAMVGERPAYTLTPSLRGRTVGASWARSDRKAIATRVKPRAGCRLITGRHAHADVPYPYVCLLSSIWPSIADILIGPRPAVRDAHIGNAEECLEAPGPTAY